MPVTLCLPDPEKSCFACCPPIRPAGYEHLPYKNMVKRMLRENTHAFEKEAIRVQPITGFSCWALGYLDPGSRQVGCLLHPDRHGGVDLRYRVDYGDKCRRETCPEAKIFLSLRPEAKRFWLHLADGLDSFSYSSRSVNPLFRMLAWGDVLLGLVAFSWTDRVFRRESFSGEVPFFTTRLPPRHAAYMLKMILDHDRVHLLQDTAFKDEFERFHERISEALGSQASPQPEDPPVHFLGLDTEFLDFLRLSLGVKRMGIKEALRLKDILDQNLETFRLRW